MANIKGKIRKQANAIISKYTGYKLPQDVAPMYDELLEMGILIPAFSSVHSDTHMFEYNGETVENSRFVYQVYEPVTGLKNDYNMYIS